MSAGDRRDGRFTGFHVVNGLPPAAERWPAPVRDCCRSASVESVEELHRLGVNARGAEPAVAMAAAEAMLALARSDADGRLVRFVRLLTRDGHDLLEFATERIEDAPTPEDRREAQRLFDETVRVLGS